MRERVVVAFELVANVEKNRRCMGVRVAANIITLKLLKDPAIPLDSVLRTVRNGASDVAICGASPVSRGSAACYATILKVPNKVVFDNADALPHSTLSTTFATLPLSPLFHRYLSCSDPRLNANRRPQSARRGPDTYDDRPGGAGVQGDARACRKPSSTSSSMTPVSEEWSHHTARPLRSARLR